MKLHCIKFKFIGNRYIVSIAFEILPWKEISNSIFSRTKRKYLKHNDKSNYYYCMTNSSNA